MEAYGALSGTTMRVRPDEIMTIRPPSLMSGRSFCVRKNTPLKCTWAVHKPPHLQQQPDISYKSCEQGRTIDFPPNKRKWQRQIQIYYGQQSHAFGTSPA